MNEVVTIEIEVAPETAEALRDPRRRQAVGRLVDRMVRPAKGSDPLARVLMETRRAARKAGLSDADIDAEIAAYRAERRT
jgi:hypothetical protein